MSALPKVGCVPAAPSALDVLVVSENPAFIEEAHSTLRPLGMRVIGCLGPAHGPCFLATRGSCPLAAHTSVALVDAPAEGTFTYQWKSIPAGVYAERVARAHPDCFVLMCGDTDGSAGPSGEVAHATSAQSALVLLRELGRARSRHTREQKEKGGQKMKIKDLQPRDLITVDGGESLRAVAKHLADDDIGALAVFDATGLVGVVSERDLARAVADGADLDDTPVEEFMTKAPITVEGGTGIGDAIAKMNEHGVRHLLVAENGDVLGMISMRDIVGLFGTHWPEL